MNHCLEILEAFKLTPVHCFFRLSHSPLLFKVLELLDLRIKHRPIVQVLFLDGFFAFWKPLADLEIAAFHEIL
jgi:hypothetical protein